VAQPEEVKIVEEVKAPESSQEEVKEQPKEEAKQPETAVPQHLPQSDEDLV
jgi:hypothetical protein